MRNAIGIDVGGTSVRAAVVQEDGTIAACASRPTGFHTPREGLLEQVAEAVGEALANAPGRTIEGAGIGMPGLQDEQGRVASASNLPTLNGVDLRAEVTRIAGVPAAMENDLNVVALGEYFFGGHKVAGNLLVVAIGTGVGAAVVQGGRLLRVFRGSLGDPGHVLVEPGGPLCRCGARGCLEAHCAGWAIVEQAQAAGLGGPRSEVRGLRSPGSAGVPPAGPVTEFDAHTTASADPSSTNQALTPADVFRAARAGDPAARGLVERVAGWLGMGLASFCALYQPERIVLGGNVLVEGADILLRPAQQHMRQIVQPWMRDIPVALSRIPQTAGVLGGAALILNH